MTVEVVAAGPLMRDELQAVASMLCTRFPEHGRLEVEWLVTGVYDGLSATARIRAHLIPLTSTVVDFYCPRVSASGGDARLSAAVEK
jgi:hypothetical protein